MRRFKGMWVSGDFFSVLGVQPWRGRLLQAADEGACPPTYAVVSYGYWQNVLGGRDLREGIKFIADNDLVQVVGVTPPSFFGMVVGDNFDIALPLCQPPHPLRRDVFEISVMGRLKPGWSLEHASAELRALSPGIFEATVPPARSSEWTNTYKNFRLAAVPAATGVSELREYDRSLYLLLGISGLVLLIACANLANLMLARGSSRQSEIAVRFALGASRGRVVRHFLMESALLATIGAALGIALAQFLGRVLVCKSPRRTTRLPCKWPQTGAYSPSLPPRPFSPASFSALRLPSGLPARRLSPPCAPAGVAPLGVNVFLSSNSWTSRKSPCPWFCWLAPCSLSEVSAIL